MALNTLHCYKKIRPISNKWFFWTFLKKIQESWKRFHKNFKHHNYFQIIGSQCFSFIDEGSCDKPCHQRHTYFFIWNFWMVIYSKQADRLHKISKGPEAVWFMLEQIQIWLMANGRENQCKKQWLLTSLISNMAQCVMRSSLEILLENHMNNKKHSIPLTKQSLFYMCITFLYVTLTWSFIFTNQRQIS